MVMGLRYSIVTSAQLRLNTLDSPVTNLKLKFTNFRNNLVFVPGKLVRPNITNTLG